jgi:RNA polymerase sigma-70 factor, ECF subfamily
LNESKPRKKQATRNRQASRNSRGFDQAHVGGTRSRSKTPAVGFWRSGFVTTTKTYIQECAKEKEEMNEERSIEFTGSEHLPMAGGVWSNSHVVSSRSPDTALELHPGYEPNSDPGPVLQPAVTSDDSRGPRSLPEPASGTLETPSMSEAHHDDRLISNGLLGDNEAFNVLFSRYRRLLYRLAYRVLRNHEESEDAVQNCLLLAYCKLPGFKHEGAFRSWLARILFNEAVSILRKRRNYVTSSSERVSSDQHIEILDTLPSLGPDPERALEKKQSTLALIKKVCELCPLQRSALLLCGVRQFTTEEASAVLKVPSNTVRTRLFRARKQLAAAMRRNESADPIAQIC